MKALTICQPWAEMIARGLKRIENRTWPTSHRGPLAIHAGKSLSWMRSEDATAWPSTYGIALPQTGELVFGAIVAVATVIDCVPIADLPADLVGSPWASGPWCWILADARRVGPIRCGGALNLWVPAAKIVEAIEPSV